MACYMGTRGGCAKLRWAAFIVALVAAVSLLAASLYKTIPGVTQLVKCIQNAADPNKIMAQAAAMAGANADPQQIVTAAQQGPSVCLRAFWDGYQITFVLSIVGVACLLVALLTCCCFCCAERPRDKEDGQFVAVPMPDTSPYGASDQYYSAPAPALPPFKPGGPGGPRYFS